MHFSSPNFLHFTAFLTYRYFGYSPSTNSVTGQSQMEPVKVGRLVTW